MTPVQRVLATARSENGYLEKATNAQLEDKTANAGYNNWNKFAAFLDDLEVVYNGKKNGYAWCDCFVDYPDGDTSILECPCCGSGEWLHNADESAANFCGQCGQAIDWTEPEVHCGDCEHLTFSDCYGECGKGYKGIVQPGDSCGKGEHK